MEDTFNSNDENKEGKTIKLEKSSLHVVCKRAWVCDRDREVCLYEREKERERVLVIISQLTYSKHQSSNRGGKVFWKQVFGRIKQSTYHFVLLQHFNSSNIQALRRFTGDLSAQSSIYS